MAVGALKCDGSLAEASSIGEGVEVVAPGENIAAYGFMDILENISGTSMAAPQVTALAAMLWQQDLSKTNTFIRNLIDATANNLGDKEKFGYGLIDCEAALENYSTVKDVPAVEEMTVEANESPLLCTSEDELEGFWSGEGHLGIFESNDSFIGKTWMQKGAVWPDDGDSLLKTASLHPQFHGYYRYENGSQEVNYIEPAILMTKASAYMRNNSGKWLSERGNKTLDELKASFNVYFKNKVTRTVNDKPAFIFGMALHTVADTFAHSTFAPKMSLAKRETASVKELVESWGALTHGKKDGLNVADKTNYTSDSSRKKYLKNCYTLRFFKKFINSNDSDVKELCNNIDEATVHNVVAEWKKGK